MSLKELRSAIEKSRSKKHDYFVRLHELQNTTDVPADLFEAVDDQDMFPSNLYYTIKLYYDPTRFRSNVAKRKLYKDAKKQYRDRDIVLQPIRPEQLSEFSLSPYVQMERRLIEPGYVIDVEGRADKHGRRCDLLVVARNIAVLQSNGFFWNEMLQEQGVNARLVREREGIERDEEILALMAPILGKRSEIPMPAPRGDDSKPFELDDNPPVIPLVLHNGLMLGSRTPRDFNDVYIAYETTPKTVVDLGLRSDGREQLYASRIKQSVAQLRFELSNCERIFVDEQNVSARENSAMATAILTWFSQVLVAQRRICWHSRASRSWDVGARQLLNEKKFHKQVIGIKKLSSKIKKAKTWNEIIEAASNSARQDIERATGQLPIAFLHEINLDDRVLAALNGSAPELPSTQDASAFFEAGLHLVIVAHWIGSLKRTGRQTLDRTIAKYIRQSWTAIESGNNDLIGHFSEEAWKLIVSASREFRPPVRLKPGRLPYYDLRAFKEPKAIEVCYTWLTEQTLKDPSPPKRTKTRIELNGPMLCFPRDQTSYWKEKAKIIQGFRGFMVPSGDKVGRVAARAPARG